MTAPTHSVSAPSPLDHRDGYPALEDLGLIGDGTTAAIVARDGLLPEEIDPSTGAFLGNYPQGFSHVGVVSSGMNLARQLRGLE